MGTLPDSRKSNKSLFHQIHPLAGTVEATIPLLGLPQMIELCIYLPTPIPLRLSFLFLTIFPHTCREDLQLARLTNLTSIEAQDAQFPAFYGTDQAYFMF